MCVSIGREYRIIATGLSTSCRDPLQHRVKTGSMVKTSSPFYRDSLSPLKPVKSDSKAGWEYWKLPRCISLPIISCESAARLSGFPDIYIYIYVRVCVFSMYGYIYVYVTSTLCEQWHRFRKFRPTPLLHSDN